MPMFQLLMLCMLASKPIDAAIAMQAAGSCSVPACVRRKAVARGRARDDDQRVRRAHYVRYDESSATRMVDIAAAVATSTAAICAGLPTQRSDVEAVGRAAEAVQGNR